MRKGKLKNIVFSIVLVIFILITSLLVCKKVTYFNCVISGSSMQPTLIDSEIGLVKKDKYVSKYERGDIVVFKKDGKDVIKRIIALPNEKIVITVVGQVYIDNVLLDESTYLEDSFLLSTALYGYNAFYNITLDEDQYFVMGDNRHNSYDSRYYGGVSKSSFEGKLKLVYARLSIDDKGKIHKHPTGWRLY